MRHPISLETARCDMNPMLDVVFILLIFFVVTAVFVREQGMDVTPPEPALQPVLEPEKNILVRIDDNNQIRVQGQMADVRRVTAHIARLRAQHGVPGLYDNRTRSQMSAAVL